MDMIGMFLIGYVLIALMEKRIGLEGAAQQKDLIVGHQHSETRKIPELYIFRKGR
jgi:hypothetical protein